MAGPDFVILPREGKPSFCAPRFKARFQWLPRAVWCCIGGVKSIALFITGTDTGVGKTVLTVALAAHLRAQGRRVAALKPVCSGGREDARAICSALRGALSLDEINPWHFKKPISPALAAGLEKKSARLRQVTAHIRRIQKKFPLLIVEGAGGLLSPLGEDFDSLDLIRALRAVPLVVCPNRLGAINQTLLVLRALPPQIAKQAHIVLSDQKKPDASAGGNLEFLSGEFAGRVHRLPWLKFAGTGKIPLAGPHLTTALGQILSALKLPDGQPCGCGGSFGRLRLAAGSPQTEPGRTS